MRTRYVHLLLAAFVIIAGTRASAQLDVGEKAPRFDIKDIHSRIIPSQQLEGWIIIYGFGNEDTANTALGYLKKATEAEPAAEGLIYVCVADTTSHNTKVLQPFVRTLLRNEYKNQINEVRSILKDKGAEYDFKLENRYILIADMQADIFKLFGIYDQRNLPHVFIVDGDHRVRGHYTEYSDDLEETLRYVLAERAGEDRYALDVKKRKRGIWKRYAVGALAAWFILN